MREYLEQIMHQSITECPYDSVEKLPLGCRNAFELTIIEIQNQEIHFSNTGRYDESDRTSKNANSTGAVYRVSMCVLFKKSKLVFNS